MLFTSFDRFSDGGLKCNASWLVSRVVLAVQLGGQAPMRDRTASASRDLLVRLFDARAAGRSHGHFHFSTASSSNIEGKRIPKQVKEGVALAKSLAHVKECFEPMNPKPSFITMRDDLERRSDAIGVQAVQGALVGGNGYEYGHRSMSLAKSLACLPEESTQDSKKPRTRMELKRSIEIRIKKRVKEQYVEGMFYDLMEKVIAEPKTLQDSYDIIRLNSNVDLGLERDDVCFDSLAGDLRRGDFDMKANAFSFSVKGGKSECLVLPNLKLRIVQEAIRIALEVVYRPSFSKISHGCRSGRGPLSALRYISQEMHALDWWFTLRMKKKADEIILSNLVSIMQEKIGDDKLFSTIRLMFDAKVLCLDFGGYPKGHGLPQEGPLSPILMNIYLDNLDSKLFRIFMKHEVLTLNSTNSRDGQSNLRHWFRRQMKNNVEESKSDSRLRLRACRYMDEIIVGVSGSKEIAVNVKKEIHECLQQYLYIDTMAREEIVAINDPSSHGIQFVGVIIQVIPWETEAVRAVHKLKDKIQLFAAKKQEVWDTAMVRIGKKWLAHGLRRIKESEIKPLGLSTPLLDRISQHRKEGMKTDHWFNVLIKVWLRDVNAAAYHNEKIVLAKCIAEPALPQELRDSFYEFQRCAKEYVSSETSSILELLSDKSSDKRSSAMVAKIDAPIFHIQKKLINYGLVNVDGTPRYVPSLVLHDDSLIIHWFSGLVNRWLRWYSKHHNFKEIKFMIVEYVKRSCIRTLAAKHKEDEGLIEKRLELDLNHIPLTEDMEIDLATMTSGSCNDDDEALTYGISHSGLCVLSLHRIEEPSRHATCSVMGCLARSPCIYTLNASDQQNFPGWKTGFASGIHPSLNRRKITLCDQHVRDLYLGNISLQSIEFGSLNS